MTLTLAGAVQAQDKDDKEAECAVQRDVVMQVVAARVDGSDMRDATKAVATTLSGDAAKYAVIVPDIAAWIYTLPEDQLNDGVGQSWVEACVAQ